MKHHVKPIRPKDWLTFRCRRCGQCCRDVEDQIMLEPLDAYRLGRYLREQGRGVEAIEDVYARYTHPSTVAEGYPIFLMNTTSPEHACVFLQDGRCSVYDARPRVCRLYPISVNVERKGAAFRYFQCMDSHAGHYSDGRVSVKDWIYHNLSKEDRAFLAEEGDRLPVLGHLLHRLDPQGQKEHLFHLLYFCYFNFNLDKPFLPQYMQNGENLKDAFQFHLTREGPACMY